VKLVHLVGFIIKKSNKRKVALYVVHTARCEGVIRNNRPSSTHSQPQH